MSAFFSRLSLFLGLCFLAPAAVLAQTAPEYDGTVFDGLTDVVLDGALFFGLIVVVALLVTGFFLGRKWLRSVG